MAPCAGMPEIRVARSQDHGVSILLYKREKIQKMVERFGPPKSLSAAALLSAFLFFSSCSSNTVHHPARGRTSDGR
jgi:hypothetical protein